MAYEELEDWEFVGLEADLKAKKRLRWLLPHFEWSWGEPIYKVIDDEEHHKVPDVVLCKTNRDRTKSGVKLELEACGTQKNWDRRRNNEFGDVQVPFRKKECLEKSLQKYQGYVQKYVQFSPLLDEFCMTEFKNVLSAGNPVLVPCWHPKKECYVKSWMYQVKFELWKWYRIGENPLGDIVSVDEFNVSGVGPQGNLSGWL